MADLACGSGVRPAEAPCGRITTAARALLDALTFDDCGEFGRGGNGGLISRETMRKTDALRMALDKVERQGSIEP